MLVSQKLLLLVAVIFAFTACSIVQSSGDFEKNTLNDTIKAEASASGPVKIKTFQSGATFQNQIYERMVIVNTGTSAVALSTVKVRFYFAYQGNTSYNFACDYTAVGNGNVQNTFTTMNPAYSGAEVYQEVSFTSGAGNLAAGASLELQCRIWKSDWSNIDNTKNYSYNPSTSSVEWNKVTLFIGGALEWGVEPGNTTSSSSIVSSTLSSSSSSSSKSSSQASISTSSSSKSSSSLTSSSAGSTGSDYPVWNSQVVYNTPGMLVQYNRNLYKNQGFAYNLNPEQNNGQYYQWLLIGPYPNGPMGEGPYIGSGNYDKYVLGAWTVFNNVWGNNTPNSQTLTAYSISNWSVVSTQPATSGVKSYPNTGLVNLNKSIASINSFTSSFDVTVPTTGDWEVAYDLWVPSEVMIWMYKNGNVSPIAAGWNSNGDPIPSATNVNVGGYTWNVYRGGYNVISFVATEATDGSWAPLKITKGSVDIKAILNWIVAQGWVSSSGICGAMQFGFEISGTDNVPLKFTNNNFTMTVN